MQRLKVGPVRNGKQNLQRVVGIIVLLSALGIGGCGVTAKPNGLGSQNTSGAGSSAATKSNVSVASQLAATPTSVNFGSVTVGNATEQLISLTNTGATSVTIASISASGGFGTTAGSNITLLANQSVNIYVSFQPSAAASATGTLTIASSAANSILQVGLSGAGTGVPSGQHAVALDWSPSASVVSGYNVYRGTAASGPYAKLNAGLNPGPDFDDIGVAGGATYYYVVTSVDSSNVESAFSNQVVVSVP
jgi:hypothetical protein